MYYDLPDMDMVVYGISDNAHPQAEAQQRSEVHREFDGLLVEGSCSTFAGMFPASSLSLEMAEIDGISEGDCVGPVRVRASYFA